MLFQARGKTSTSRTTNISLYMNVCLQGEHKEYTRKAEINILCSPKILNPGEAGNWQESIIQVQFFHLKKNNGLVG